jgi:DNA invertase Pin-like site-specific DNA recombinase
MSMVESVAALYARVSSDQQARGNTVASQVAALREQGEGGGSSAGPGPCFR